MHIPKGGEGKMAKEIKAKYTNGFSLSTTLGETRLLFLLSTPKIDEKDGSESATFKDVADMRMNVVLAKQLSIALQDSIRNYEKAYGEVVLPKQGMADGRN